MARIVSFKELEAGKRSRPHTEVECGYAIVSVDGQTLLQLDTYGSDEREIPGKVSQSIQLDRSAAERLGQILERAFPGLGR
jgi:hypothetical protein